MNVLFIHYHVLLRLVGRKKIMFVRYYCGSKIKKLAFIILVVAISILTGCAAAGDRQVEGIFIEGQYGGDAETLNLLGR